MKSLHYLKTFRKRTGISLSDMSTLIGIDAGNLSKMEAGQREITTKVLLAYYVILKIPIERLFKNQLSELVKNSYQNSVALKDRVLDAMGTPNINHRIILLDVIIDRLNELQQSYEN